MCVHPCLFELPWQLHNLGTILYSNSFYHVFISMYTVLMTKMIVKKVEPSSTTTKIGALTGSCFVCKAISATIIPISVSQANVIIM